MSKNNIIIMCAPHSKKKDPVTPHQHQQQPPGPMILRSHCVWLIVVRTVIVVQFVYVVWSIDAL